ncbi:hypothetical protein [Streptomyces barringtoniae]|uniref:hypothetical protein n=1 Tax=Streptomyces barringtoniae TaxID=2892029 RepID=UPI001E3505FC|nr:hypothetical protein [Streptomyces barringtoniae]MCC5481214.1 hypothetical protein [Streptomyces barringtoniae]
MGDRITGPLKRKSAEGALVPRPLPRNALGASVTAFVAGLLTLGAPSVGRAEETAQTLEFTVSEGGNPLQVQPYQGDYATAYLHARNTGSQQLTHFTVTVDAAAVKGQMSLKPPAACVEKQQLLYVCDGEKLNYGKPLQSGDVLDGLTLQFQTLSTAHPGFAGDVRISAEAGDTTLGGTTFKAEVPDKGPLLDRSTPSATWPKTGETVRPGLGFTNFSSRPLNGVYIAVRVSQGLSFGREFSNCEYGRMGDAGVGARCYVETPVTAGGSYDLDDFSVRVGGTARRESWSVAVYGTTDGYDYKHLNLTDVHRGTGRALKVTPRADGPKPFNRNYGTGWVYTNNPFDLEALGTTVHGTAGQVVEAKLGVRNNGPASIEQYDRGEGPGDGPTSEAHVTIPPGTTAVKVPNLCRSEGDWHQGEPGARHYTCFQDENDSYFDAGQLTPFVFGLRIDRPADLAPGSVKVTLSTQDSNAKDNTAAITVTADGSQGHGSGSSAGSSAGSGSGSGGGSASGGASGSASAGSGTAASGSTGRGSMADTGTGALPWYVAAAAVVALITGGALFVVVRRRRN